MRIGGAAAAVLEEGALADQPAPQPVAGGLIDHAEARAAADDQADVDGIIVAAADEFLGAVERIDEEIGVAMRRDAARRDFLLGDDRHARRGVGQRVEDDPLGRAVADGDRRLVALGLDLEPAFDQLQDLRARRARGDDAGFEERCFVHQRGAIRMPPSRRMLSALR